MPTTEDIRICEKIDEANLLLVADQLTIERLKAQGFFCVIEDGRAKWGTA